MRHRARRARPRVVAARWFLLGERGRVARGVAVAAGACATMALLCGCESTQERSAQLRAAAKHEVLATQGVSVTKENPSVKVLQSTVVHSREGTAVVVALRNTSSHALENAPIEITVRDAHGSVIFQNDEAGIQPSLATVSLLEPDAETVWIDDQVHASGTPASVSALVGEAKQATGSVPRLSLAGGHLSSEGGAESTLAGTVANGSRVSEQNLVVYALARRGSKIVAAGRAVLPEVGPGAELPFQVYFIGDPAGAHISTSAPPTSF